MMTPRGEAARLDQASCSHAARHWNGPLLELLSSQTGPMSRESSLAQAQCVIRNIIASQYDRPSLVADIACEIGAEIVEAVIAPGHDLNTVDLARRYQTSRTPVREALMLLENEGLVDIAPRRRPRARMQTIEEVSEIYRTRTVLLELMGGEAAKRASEADLALLCDILSHMARACERKDVIAYAWLSVEFHDHDTRFSGNSTAKRIHDSLLIRTLAVRRLSLSRPERIEKSLYDHTQLLRAYENRQSDLAAAILRANHTESLAAVERFSRQTGSLSVGHAGASAS